jgi:hypothetical protein
LRRDQHRCQAPGCQHATFVDVHHLETRHEGGAHEADNLIVLCSAHHRAAHRGELLITGRVSTGVTFRHADGSDYGALASVPAVDAQSRAFRALRGLGFAEGEARRALDQTRPQLGSESDFEVLLRSALQLLTRSSFAKAS